jgi:hypothetical protein
MGLVESNKKLLIFKWKRSEGSNGNEKENGVL